jgi:hypothetical protein
MAATRWISIIAADAYVVKISDLTELNKKDSRSWKTTVPA